MKPYSFAKVTETYLDFIFLLNMEDLLHYTLNPSKEEATKVLIKLKLTMIFVV